jgi:hypothetical protein
MIGQFPFGKPVEILKQTDCSPKKVFILGVYASAVHAKWLNPQGKKVVEALAVASEPYIFWKGEDAEKYIPSIPKEVGTLIPASKQLNGPSGIALDDLFIAPLGLTRKDCWLCDLVPHSCVNTRQRAAIRRAYNRLAKESGLPEHSVPDVPKRLTNEQRREEIYAELVQSKATRLVLLGAMPIKWFVHFFDPRWSELSDFLTSGNGYGKPVKARIKDVDVEIVPLAHPRQAARLGASSEKWGQMHDEWMREGVS